MGECVAIAAHVIHRIHGGCYYIVVFSFLAMVSVVACNVLCHRRIYTDTPVAVVSVVRLGKMSEVNRKNYLIDCKNLLYPIFSLHTCTKSIAYM